MCGGGGIDHIGGGGGGVQTRVYFATLTILSAMWGRGGACFVPVYYLHASLVPLLQPQPVTAPAATRDGAAAEVGARSGAEADPRARNPDAAE